jgi:Ni/Co efflux regulator RcnB
MKHADNRAKQSEIIANKHLSLIHGNLTPGQSQKFNEFLISSMSETEFVFPGMFEALDLSDEQKKQLGDITKEIDPMWKKHMGVVDEYRSKHSKRQAEVLKGVTDPQEMVRLLNEYIASTPEEFQSERDKMMESGKKLADELKIKMFDVLTDKQWDRMVQLTDNPPEYVKKMLAQVRKWREDAANKPKPGEWVPGPNSWKPGDPIPEQYRQQRQEQIRTRQRPGFPRNEVE